MTITGAGTARINDSVTLTCETSNSNPASSIQWVVGGRIQQAAFTRNDTSEEGGWITTSNITIPISNTDRNKEISCYANNFALSTTKVQTHKIKVLCKYFFILFLCGCSSGVLTCPNNISVYWPPKPAPVCNYGGRGYNLLVCEINFSLHFISPLSSLLSKSCARIKETLDR